jgi:adenylate cyclase
MNSAPSKRPLIMLAICAVITLALLFLWVRGFVPLVALDNAAQDWQTRLGRKTPMNDQLVLIGIDKPVYESDFSNAEVQKEPVLADLQKNWPWSREVWARLTEKLADAGAKVIVYDLVFAAQSDGDDKFSAVLNKYRDHVVIGYNISLEKTDRGTVGELQFPNTSVTGEETNSPVQDDRLGYVNIWPDTDDVLRRANYRKNGAQLGDILPPGTVAESLDSQALRKYGHPEAIPAGFDPRVFRYTARPGTGYKAIPIGYVLSPNLWATNYQNGAFFKDKIVLIGPMAEIFQDVHNTPFDDPKSMPGPEIHLQIMNAALHGEFLHEPSLVANSLVIILAGILTFALCIYVQQSFKRLLIITGLVTVYWVLTYCVLNNLPHFSQIMPVATPTLILLTCGLIALAYDFVIERLERMKLRHTMGLYFSPKVMEVVLADPGSMHPRRASVVLLLTDLRNSTPLAELLGPKGMFDLLNRVFEAQTNAIMGEDGNLEHFLGDQFLSYWGAPQKQPDAADRAERAAMKLIAAMEKLRGTLAPEVQKLFGYGVALHSGSVLVGNKGSALRLDYGLVGDTVNEAARVESLTKYYGARLLITRDTFAQLQSQTLRRLVDRVIVKGKSEPVELFECENPCTPANYADICARYKAAYNEYFFGNFAEAKNRFTVLAQEFSDGPSKALAARCEELINHPPADWQGIWKMDAK